MNPLKIDAQEVVRVIVHSLRGLFAWLCEIIYPWIANLYDIFKELGTQVYSEDFVKIYNKISLIIGIFMVFRVTFWLIESLINPDSMSDKEKTPYKIIQKVFIAIILLATTPTIFKTAFQVQNKILESEIIEKIISTGETLDQTNTTMGRYLSAELFVNFYSPTIVDINGKKAYSKDKCVSDFTEYTETSEHGLIYKGLLFHGKLNDLTGECLTKKENLDGKKNDYIIDFNGLFAVAVGIFVLWMLLMYCISLGTRYVQLIYLQVIAPIPIMCYLAPSKDNMFSKWIKQCTTTYLDLFIRIAIINFVMLLCTLILSNESNALEGIENTTGWIQLFLVLGLLAFAKKAPELIQELLPKSLTKASGDFGLSLKKRSESMLGGKFMYNSGKKAIGFLGAMPGMLAATGVRAYNAHKYNQRENAKLEDYRAKRVSMFKENKEKAIANWRNKGLTEEQIKENAAKFDKKIDRVSNQSKASLRRELRQGTSNLTKAYEKTKYTNREVAANLIERIDENRDSGMGHRNQGLTTASSLIGGTYRAANAAIHGKSVGEIISKANESHVKKIIQEQSWYNKDGGDT